MLPMRRRRRSFSSAHFAFACAAAARAANLGGAIGAALLFL
jgi:hypothetical protein